jgi:hypothetical protein
MISRGFAELREANPALSYSIILDMLSGINECVTTGCIEIIFIYFHNVLETLLSDNTFKHLGDSSLTNALSGRVR